MGKVIIIAEAGVNHNGDFDLAKKMIDIAFESLNGGFIDSVKLIDNMEKRNIPPKILDYYFNLLRCKYIFFKREG